MNGYIVLYRGQRAELYADSQYEAQVAGVRVFNPPRSKRHLVTAHLAELDGQTVTQVITS